MIGTMTGTSIANRRILQSSATRDHQTYDSTPDPAGAHQHRGHTNLAMTSADVGAAGGEEWWAVRLPSPSLSPMTNRNLMDRADAATEQALLEAGVVDMTLGMNGMHGMNGMNGMGTEGTEERLEAQLDYPLNWELIASLMYFQPS